MFFLIVDVTAHGAAHRLLRSSVVSLAFAVYMTWLGVVSLGQFISSYLNGFLP